MSGKTFAEIAAQVIQDERGEGIDSATALAETIEDELIVLGWKLRPPSSSEASDE